MPPAPHDVEIHKHLRELMLRESEDKEQVKLEHKYDMKKTDKYSATFV